MNPQQMAQNQPNSAEGSPQNTNNSAQPADADKAQAPQEPGEQAASDPSKNQENQPSESNATKPDTPENTNTTKPSNSTPANKNNSASKQNSSTASTPSTNQQSNSSQSNPASPNQNDLEPLPFDPGEQPAESGTKPEAPKSDESGATPPPNDMSQRMLDVSQQSSTSSKQRLVVDEYASRFEGQRRKKYQMAIDPVLKKLKELLTKAGENAQLYQESIQSSSSSNVEIPQSYKMTAQQLKGSLDAIRELQNKSAGTPYAFIGLQLTSIQESHVDPAAILWADLLKSATNEEKQPDVEKTIFHIQRALVLLDQLTRKYENAKRDEEIADKLARIEKMYQVYLEDSMQMLGNQKPVNNVTEGSPVEVEYSEEFLKKLEELLKKREALFAELAKILAEDPRLLKRFMDSLQDNTSFLRDQLSEINQRQQRLTREGLYWQKYQERLKAAEPPAEGEDPPPFPEALLERHHQQVYQLVEDAGAIHDKFVTWLPKEIQGLEGEVKEVNEQAAKLTNEAALLLKEDVVDKAAKAKELVKSYEQFQARIGEIHQTASPEFKEHLTNRATQIQELVRDLESWIESAEAYEKQDYLAAAEIDQYNLLDDIYVFVSKFQTIETQLSGFPSDIRKTAFDLKRKLQIDVSSEMTSSETELHRDNLEQSLVHQQKAHQELDAAEKLFDKMLDRMMEEYEKAPPPGSPDPNDLQFNLTLEELLALLEREGSNQEQTLLALFRRPSNLQIVLDWFKPSPGGGGMMGIASAQMQQQQLNRLQDDLLKKAQAQLNKSGSRKEDWNKLISTLEAGMKQNQGKLTPEQYRAAIDQYFEVLAREMAEQR
ncbi:MAG: hypothetical protein R3C11_10920 [Planctomycetaceae bacterium]